MTKRTQYAILAIFIVLILILIGGSVLLMTDPPPKNHAHGNLVISSVGLHPTPTSDWLISIEVPNSFILQSWAWYSTHAQTTSRPARPIADVIFVRRLPFFTS